MTRMPLHLRLATGLAASFFAVLPAMAAAPQGISLSDSRVRMVVPSRPAAGYFTLTNNSDKAVSLVGASSPDCGSAMLHQSVKENGVDKMIMVKSVDVPAHGTLSFSPGHYHLMCMEPTAEVRAGNKMPVTLTFADGSTLDAMFDIGGPATK